MLKSAISSLKDSWRLRQSLWIDRPDAMSVLQKLDADAKVKQAISDLIVKGVATIRKNNDEHVIDEVVRDFDSYCRENADSRNYVDQYGLHERLCNLHMVSAAARKITQNRTTRAVIASAFRREPVVVGSLLFEKGSQQSIHRDGPAFFTVPIDHFFGVWNALEDITEDSGPLTYFEGGHRAISDKELRSDGVTNNESYFQRVIADCERRGCPLRDVLLSKGDTLIWHALLPHGGSKILDPRKSRKSLVSHYIPVGVPIYGPSVFFGPGVPSARGPNFQAIEIDGGKFLDQGSPKFFHNYDEGNFHEV